MASSLSCILFLSLFALTSLLLEASQPKHQSIGLDSTLNPTTPPSSWLSPSGRYAFGFYPQATGFSIGIWLITSPGNTTVIWTDRDQAPVTKDAVLKLTTDGLKLHLQTSRDIAISLPTSNTSSASMLNSGNFVIYDSSYNITWQSFDYPTDTMVGGQSLPCNSDLVSSVSETNHSSGAFMLSMQCDGNLVLYNSNGSDTSWASGTDGEGYTSLNLDTTGRLYLRSFNNYRDLWNYPSSSSETHIYLAKLDTDNAFRLYALDLKTNKTDVVTEIPDRKNKCQSEGNCGLNSFCSLIRGQPVCSCLPGFASDNGTRARCQRNFTKPSCQGDDGNNIRMQSLENIVWLDEPYNILSLSNREDCRQHCLNDCNCDAAVFSNLKCAKQKVPLKSARIDAATPAVAFIKVFDEIPLPSAPGSSIKKEVSTKALLVSATIIVGIYVTVLVVSISICRYQRGWKKWELALTEEIAPLCFSFSELREATDGFRDMLGRGGFGSVFKGILSDSGREIAVKRLDNMAEERDREFRAEMRVIGRTHHRNLIRLLGFCLEGSNRLLVYEYMSNGSLAERIFKPEGGPSWDERVRIVVDVARGIRYLHEGCRPPIIHCDIKPENILMDVNWTAKISDLGVAKLLMPSQTRTFTAMRGTKGYAAPEWRRNVPISVKADVYSFGIVLLEIVCCRRNMEVEVEGDEFVLWEWVYDCYEAKVLENLLQGEEEVKMAELEKVVKVGIWCIQQEPAFRPSMKNVVTMLEGNMNVSDPPPRSIP